MLSLFKRSKTKIHPTAPHYGLFSTVSQRLKPMTEFEFEMAEQSLEAAFDWFYPSVSNYLNGGHCSIENANYGLFQAHLSQCLGSRLLPVILTNAHETMVSIIPVLDMNQGDIGIVSINQQFEMSQSLDLRVSSAYHFVLSQYNNCRLFCVGIDETQQPANAFEYAEDQGCDWLTHSECHFRHRFQVKNQVATFINHCDELVLDIDLDSLIDGFARPNALDMQTVLRLIRQCVMSGKVKLIQVVGVHDKLIYSKQAKMILDEVAALLPSRNDAA